MQWVHRVATECRQGVSLARLFFVLVLLMAQGLHAVTHFQPQNIATQAVVASAQLDQNSDNKDATVAAEACHMCSVVPFLAVAPSIRVAMDAHVIPEGVRLHLAVFANSLTAPPPRA